MSSALNSAASLTVKKNDVFQETFKSAPNFNPELKAIASSSTAKLLKPKTSGSSVAKRIRKRCPHDKIKRNCIICAPHRFCQHRKQKAQCKLCGGTQICDHGKIKQSCKHCADRCEHGKYKAKCKLCGGSEICEHWKFKSACRECGGSGICTHDKRKDSCLDCMPLEKAIAKGMICKICCGKSTRNGICKSCSVSFKSSTEVSIEALIKLCLYHFFGDHIKSNFNSMIGGQSCKDALDGSGDCEEKTK